MNITKCVPTYPLSFEIKLLVWEIIDMDAAIEFREHCKEVSKDELDMIIKAECLPIGILVVS
jgi:hypothetical protein